jgi:hypothetical protein
MSRPSSKTKPSNKSLERSGEQLMMMEPTVPSETKLLKQPVVPPASLRVSSKRCVMYDSCLLE